MVSIPVNEEFWYFFRILILLLETLVLSLDTIICVDINFRTIFLVKPYPSLKKKWIKSYVNWIRVKLFEKFQSFFNLGKNSCDTENSSIIILFSLSVFFSYDIHDSQDSRGKRKAIFSSSLPHPRFMNTDTLAGRLVQRAHLYT